MKTNNLNYDSGEQIITTYDNEHNLSITLIKQTNKLNSPSVI